MTDGVFSAGEDGEAIFHPALDLEPGDFEAVQAKMRRRGLRWLHRHGHLDDDALHVLDSSEHAGGWSVDASVTIPGRHRQGLERLARYCARPPLSQERLGRLNEQTLVYSRQLRRCHLMTASGWTKRGGRRYPAHNRRSRTQNARSRSLNRGRGLVRCRTRICWRWARFPSSRSRRGRKRSRRV
ncbi:MAG: transposase [bacterium]|nr:transposase [bacterium]